MTRATLAGGRVVTLLAAFALVACNPSVERDVDAAGPATPLTTSTPSTAATQEGFLYGRVTTNDGAVHEGRLRWGVDEEALWSNYFNGVKRKNPWVALAPRQQLPKERHSIRIFGIEVIGWDQVMVVNRPFMARFGDIARIDPGGRDLQVTLKSGTVVHLARFAADDLADGVRVWDDRGGFVDIGEWKIRTVEHLPAPRRGTVASPLYGTVRTRDGAFTGLVQWDRRACVGADELEGNSTTGRRTLRFDAIRSIARRSPDSSLVTLLDGSEVVLSGTRAVGRGNSGIYVDDQRYGRVLVSWDVFERVDFSPGATAPGYEEYLAGRALTGDVVTRSGRRLAGRLVFDLDESETTETLDAPSRGVDYTIPFSLIASIVPGAPGEGGAQRASVTLLGGEVLQLERTGDLSKWNAGMLIFAQGRERPEHVPWADVERVDFDRRPEKRSPGGQR
jgi:hypothetical protein